MKVMMGLSYERNAMYREYEYMMQDSIISSAIELYTEEATQASYETGKPFWITAEEKGIVEEFEKFSERLKMETLYHDVVHNACVYGDQFPRLYYGKEGMTFIDSRIHPADVEKASIGNYILGYRYDNRFFKPKDFYHVKMNFAKPQRREQYTFLTVTVEGQDIKIRPDYGTSVLENARKIYKIMNLLENSLLVARLTRSPLQQVIGVNVSGEDTEEAFDFISKLKESLSQDITIDLMNKRFDALANDLEFNIRTFIPIFNEKGRLEVTSVGGDVDIQHLADIEYFRNKLYGALRVPKAYLGIEESLPGSLGESALARLEIRFGKTVKRIQRTGLQMVMDLFCYHLAHIDKADWIGKFSIEGTPISSKEDEERKNTLKVSMETAEQFLGLMNNLNLIADEDEETRFDVLTSLNSIFIKMPLVNRLIRKQQQKGEEKGAIHEVCIKREYMNPLMKSMPKEDLTEFLQNYPEMMFNDPLKDYIPDKKTPAEKRRRKLVESLDVSFGVTPDGMISEEFRTVSERQRING